MKKWNAISGVSSLMVLSVLVATVLFDLPQQAQPTPEPTSVVQAIANLPLSFEANQGQTDGRVDFLARGQGYTLFLASDAAILRVGDAVKAADAVVRLNLKGASGRSTATGVDELAKRTNYFTGKDPSGWRTGVPAYQRVRYDAVYPGIDIVYYGNAGALEYDFVVSAGADPGLIAIEFDGADAVEIQAGELLVHVGERILRQRAPTAYQRSGSELRAVASRYEQRADGSIGFEVAAYDLGRPLIIDPVIQYSTYLGGSSSDRGLSLAVDGDGAAYVVGESRSVDFPGATSPQTRLEGDTDVFVAKLNTTGTGLLFSTYIGGSGGDRGNDIVIDASGSICITGETASNDFPTVLASQDTYGGGDSDAFVTRLSGDGATIEFSTYIGGSDDDRAFGIDIDGGNEIFIAGETESADLPMINAVQSQKSGQVDAFAAVVDAPSAIISFCTFLGGSSSDRGRGVVAWGNGEAYIVGWTSSDDFPVAGALQPEFGGGASDAFVVRINAANGTLAYATYVGGSGDDRALGVAIDDAYRAHVTGETNSDDFPTVAALQPARAGALDAFVLRLAENGASLEYATFIGGRGGDRASAISVDADGTVYLAGGTSSPDFPMVGAVQADLRGIADAFVVTVRSGGTQLDFSSFVGGSAVDPARGIASDGQGGLYIAGTTLSSDFPTKQPLQNGLVGSSDAFIVHLGATATLPDTSCNVDVPPDSILPGLSTIPQVVLDGFKIQNTSTVPVAFDYAVSEDGLAELDDNGDPSSLVGRTPLLAPGESYVPGDAVLLIPPIRHYRELLVYYDVVPVGSPGLGHSVVLTVTVEPPVAVFITSFAGYAVESGIRLEWDIYADEAIRGFKLYRASGDEPMAVVNSGTLLASGARGYVDSDVNGGERYRYTLAVVGDDNSETLSPVVIVDASVRSLALAQNHPNPFNPSTTIAFVLPRAASAEIAVFDAKGGLVRTLGGGPMAEGPHTVTWNGRDQHGEAVSSGVYFYRLQADGRTLTRKMLLLK